MMLQTAWFHFSHCKELESDEDECKETLNMQILCMLDNTLIIANTIMDIQINIFNIIKMCLCTIDLDRLVNVAVTTH